MAKFKNAIYYFVWFFLFFAIPIGSSETLLQLFDSNDSSIGQLGLILGFIIFFYLIYCIETKKDKIIKEKDYEFLNKLHNAIDFMNLINKIDYSRLSFIKDIQLAEMYQIKFIFKNNNSTQLYIEEINNALINDGIVKLDNYLNKNYILSNNEKNSETFIESFKLHDAIKYYHSYKNC